MRRGEEGREEDDMRVINYLILLEERTNGERGNDKG